MNTNIPGPWQNEAELAMVRDWFYPSHSVEDPYELKSREDMRSEAIARVNVWTFKSHKTPVAVISTADLTDSIIHYEKMVSTNNPDSYRAVQFMFAFAFLRFVNSFVDRDVAKAATAALITSEDDDDDETSVKIAGESSMYAHAAAISMPNRFVDLRHQVSHGQLPDVKALRDAANEGLTWLWERWWKGNATGDPTTALRYFKATSELRAQTQRPA
ncbi:rRNA-processing protein las1 [Lithohypha guttulata]|uniref:rRNA-processing protein las1 n=1 Tax=Lithohypha guttulata TaxID=1690604 RepID=A0AAN7YGH2_9EURO|nr:rRNA-processing protein las1 [Lithohypha guttulata]KAK5085712.1 rRNA-processing protein las1 [Lithohypha guttulata]KAK5103404.1 rRNA-processing protein las1 [Lithohypha guttulata]